MLSAEKYHVILAKRGEGRYEGRCRTWKIQSKYLGVKERVSAPASYLLPIHQTYPKEAAAKRKASYVGARSAIEEIPSTSFHCVSKYLNWSQPSNKKSKPTRTFTYRQRVHTHRHKHPPCPNPQPTKPQLPRSSSSHLQQAD